MTREYAGVGFCISNKVILHIDDVDQIDSRICVLCLKTTKSWRLALISAYVEMHCNIDISGKPNSSDNPKILGIPDITGY